MARLLLLTILSGCLAAMIAPQTWGQQKFDPPGTKPPPEETIQAIRAKMALLNTELEALRKKDIPDDILVEIEVYHRAAEMMLLHREFYHKDSAAWTLDTLDRGIARAKSVTKAAAPWLAQPSGKVVLRGYRSRIDGTAQPYAVTYPHGFSEDPAKKWRLDVVLHGRDSSLTEVKFLNANNGTRKVPAKQDYVQLDIFGRGNNAYRWAGETDVLEAIEHFLSTETTWGCRKSIDPRRVVLRGFSMGGAGAWHLGLHHPDKWCVIGPGAGFTTTHGYVKFPQPLPAYQEACLKIYDAIDYAENAASVPIVAYSGEKDAQKAAADNIEARLKKLGIPMTHLVAPDLAHTFPAAWFDKANQLYSKHAATGRIANPDKVSFVTYTTKYPSCDGIEIVGLEKHYTKASVLSEWTDKGIVATTANVQALKFDLRPRMKSETANVVIDGQSLQVKVNTGIVTLSKVKGAWRADPLPAGLRKAHGLQGPIDDAFTEGFLCVRGTGRPWHDATRKFADARLAQFQADWSKHFRGTLPIKNDADVTKDDIARKHLVLFGDPSSNSQLSKALEGLPLSWTKETITFAGKQHAAREHVPMLVYPNPLNPRRYVVLNTGHTFPSDDYAKTNALLFPRLGDYAILRIDAKNGEPVVAGLFNEQWQIEK